MIVRDCQNIYSNKYQVTIILFTTLSSRGRAFTRPRIALTIHVFTTLPSTNLNCSSLLVRQLKYYMRPKTIL